LYFQILLGITVGLSQYYQYKKKTVISKRNDTKYDSKIEKWQWFGNILKVLAGVVADWISIVGVSENDNSSSTVQKHY